GHTGGSNYRIPVVHRLLHPFLVGPLTDGHARVVDPVRDHWPTVVLARLRLVQSIAPLCPVFHRPQVASGIQSSRLGIAVSQRPDGCHGTVATSEGIVGGNRAILVDTHDLADAGGEILHQGALIHAVAGSDEQGTVPTKYDARTVVAAIPSLRRLAIDHLNILESVRTELCASGRSAGGAFLLPGFGEGEVDGPVGSEIGI